MSVATDWIGGVIAGSEDLMDIVVDGWEGAGIGITLESGSKIHIFFVPYLIVSFVDILNI